jgi:hypothetical protein
MAGRRPLWGSRPPSGKEGRVMDKRLGFDVTEAVETAWRDYR